MKIEGASKLMGSILPSESRSRQPAGGAGATGGGDASVKISSLSSSLGKAEAAMASSPSVDKARIAELRQAISEGRFSVDASKVADSLISSVRQMLEVQA